MMRRALAIAAVAAIAVLGALGPTAGAAQPQASISCVNASTPGGTRCLAAGQFCLHKPGYASAYKHAGFRCKRNGHLTYR